MQKEKTPLQKRVLFYGFLLVSSYLDTIRDISDLCKSGLKPWYIWFKTIKTCIFPSTSLVF